MANSLSASIATYMSKRMQAKHWKKDVYRAIANFSEEDTLSKGDTVTKPYRSDFDVNDMGSEGSFTRQDITDTSEQLEVDQEKDVAFYIKDLDVLQHHYDVRNKYSDDLAKKLSNQVDADFLYTCYAGADNTATAVTLTGGSSQNVLSNFAEAGSLLDAQDVDGDGRFAVVSPQYMQQLWQQIANKDTGLADKAYKNGYKGNVNNFDIYLSNNLPWSGTLALATNPTADDTITIAGVTFTFVAVPSSAGEIDIAGTVDATRELLADAINNADSNDAGEGSATTYFEVSAADRKKLKGITATNDNTNDVLTISAVGRSYLAVSETLTDGTDEWTTNTLKQHNLFGRKGAGSLVIQKRPNVGSYPRTGYVGQDIVAWIAYGSEVFSEGAVELVDVPIYTGAF